MIAESTASELKKLLCREVEVEQQGIDRYVVYAPFTFDDGDHYVCIVERCGDKWCVTDEGHTFMHMSYRMSEFLKGTRGKIIQDALAIHRIECNEGVLKICVPERMISDAVFSLLHGISKISNVTKFTRDAVKSTFLEDFRNAMTELIGKHEATFGWHDPIHDQEELYSVDCRIQGSHHPWHVYAVGSIDKCRSSTISCLKMEQFAPDSRSIAIFADQSSVNPKAVAQLTDVVWKPFSSLGERERIEKYFSEEVFPGNGSA